jgi:hypothetical protein
MLRFLAATTKAADTQKTIASTLRPSGLSLEVKLLLLLLLLQSFMWLNHFKFFSVFVLSLGKLVCCILVKIDFTSVSFKLFLVPRNSR